MRAFVNPAYDRSAVPAPSREPLSFHAALDGYVPTPVHSLPFPALGAVGVKDESARLGLPAFKVLGVSWAVERALRLDPYVSTLVAASAGNHGRAVARVAAQRGLYCRIMLPERALPARREAIAAEGADVEIVPGTYEDAVVRAQRYAEGPNVVELADVGSSSAASWVIDGYATLFAELDESWDVIVVPVGVGSLAAAAARHGAATGTFVIGAEPDVAACLTAALAAGDVTATVPTPGTVMAGLDCAAVSVSAWSSLQPGIGGTVTVSDDEARAAQRELAAAAGLDIGESGAASLAALHALTEDPECAALREAAGIGSRSRVLLIATEGRTA